MLSEQQIHLYQILGIDSNIESSSSACEEKCDILKKVRDAESIVMCFTKYTIIVTYQTIQIFS